jgi:hypothetical protein
MMTENLWIMHFYDATETSWMDGENCICLGSQYN